MADPSKSTKSAVSYTFYDRGTILAPHSQASAIRRLQKGCEHAPSRINSIGEYNHFAVDDLIFGKKLRSGF